MAGGIAGLLVAGATLAIGGSASALAARDLSLDLVDESTSVSKELPAIVVDPGTERAFALSRLRDQVIAYDVSGNTVRETGSITVGTSPVDIAIDIVTHRLAVTDDVANTVTVIDVDPGSFTNNTVIATHGSRSGNPTSIVIDDTQNTAYFIADTPPSVGQMNLATGATTVTPVSGAGDITVDPTTHTAYVYTATGNLVAIAGGAVVADAPTGKTFRGITFSDGLLYVGAMISAGSYDVETYDSGLNAVGASPLLGDRPVDIRVDAELQLVYVLYDSADLRALRLGELVPEGPADLTGTDPTAAFAVDLDSHRVFTSIKNLVSGAVFRMWNLEASPLTTTTTLPNGRVGVPYSQQIETVAWPPASAFALTGTGSFPPGLQLNATTGEIFNTPTTPGTYTFGVSASNGIGMPALTGYTIVIDPAAGMAPTITSGSPTGATVGTPYSFFVTATGMPAPTYTVSSGMLPDGLTLDAATGELRGKPTTAGTSTFTITASNSVGADSAEVSLTVARAVGPTPTPTPTPSPTPTTTPQPTTAPGGNGNGSTGTTGGGFVGAGSGTGGGSSNGRLASTGADGLGTLAGIGFALALGAAGLTAIVTTIRRRRS